MDKLIMKIDFFYHRKQYTQKVTKPLKCKKKLSEVSEVYILNVIVHKASIKIKTNRGKIPNLNIVNYHLVNLKIMLHKLNT